jgi:hypothetical protein
MHRLVGTPPESKRKPRPAPQPMVPIPEAIYCSAPQIRRAPLCHITLPDIPTCQPVGSCKMHRKQLCCKHLMTLHIAEAHMKGGREPPTGSEAHPTPSRLQYMQSQLRPHPQLDFCPHVDLGLGPQLLPRSLFLPPRVHEKHQSHPGYLAPCHHPGVTCTPLQRHLFPM